MSAGLIAVDPGRGELDGERDPVDPAADLTHRAPLRVAPRHRGPGIDRAVGEQPDRGGVHERVARRVPIGSVERPHPHHPFAGHVERLTTRHDDPHVRAALGARASARSAASSTRCSQLSRTSSRLRTLRYSMTLSVSDRPGRCTQPSVVATTWATPSASSTGRELAEPRAVAEAREGLGRDLDGEPGLAHSARADERHERGLVEQRLDAGDVVVTPDERGDLHRQVPAERVERRQPRELARELGVRDLEDPLGSRQVAQRVLPQVHELDGAVREELLGRQREDDLTAVGDRHQSRRPVDRGAVVVAVAEIRGTGVDTDAHPQPTRDAPTPPRRARAGPRSPRRPRRARRGTRRGSRRRWSSPRGRRAPRSPRPRSRRAGRARPPWHRGGPATVASTPRGR